MDWKSQIKEAGQRIEDHVVKTPTFNVQGFGLPFSVEIKLEHMQHTGSFKARGAFNTLLSKPVPAAGLVAASGGNHGAAVAFAAGQLGHKARIYVPEMAGPAKISLIRETGADLRVVPGAYSNALEQARNYEEKTGAMQVHAYDAEPTIAGQGTCFAEWESQELEADTIFIAVGGGGLIAGALAWFGSNRNVVAVEPEKSCALSSATNAGEPVDVEVGGVAANALGAKRVGDICFDMVQQNKTQTVLVPDAAITRAQHLLWRERRILAEPAGATALAALISGAYQPEPGERVAVLICGGNIAPDPLA
ncbi:MAG: threonine/serine dehydratase [Paracoccaceae bacterium]